MLEQYPKEVKLVIKQFPIPSHSFARKAAMGAFAADNQGKFWEMHKSLLEEHRDLNDAKMESIARKLGLDMEQFNRDLKDAAVAARIDRDVNHAVQAEVRGTPTVLINGKLLAQRSLEGFAQAIEAELKKKK